MTSPSKARGDRWERECVKLVIAHGFRDGARMLRLGAHVDEGDIIGVPDALIDCKDAQRHEFSAWLDAVDREAVYLNRHGALFVKRARRDPASGFAVERIDAWLDVRRRLADALARIDELENT